MFNDKKIMLLGLKGDKTHLFSHVYNLIFNYNGTTHNASISFYSTSSERFDSSFAKFASVFSKTGSGRPVSGYISGLMVNVVNISTLLDGTLLQINGITAQGSQLTVSIKEEDVSFSINFIQEV